jgi:hypothetical protein
MGKKKIKVMTAIKTCITTHEPFFFFIKILITFFTKDLIHRKDKREKLTANYLIKNFKEMF